MMILIVEAVFILQFNFLYSLELALRLIYLKWCAISQEKAQSVPYLRKLFANL